MIIDPTNPTIIAIFFVLPLILVLAIIAIALYIMLAILADYRFDVTLPGIPPEDQKPFRQHAWIGRMFGYSTVRYWLIGLTVTLVSAILALGSPNDNVAVLAALTILTLLVVIASLVAQLWPHRSRHLVEADQFERLRPRVNKIVDQIGSLLRQDLGAAVELEFSNWLVGQRGTLRLPGYLSLEQKPVLIDGRTYYRIVLSLELAFRDAHQPELRRQQMDELYRLLDSA